MDKTRNPSQGFAQLVKIKEDAFQVKLKARAKEASAVSRLLRCIHQSHPYRENLENRLRELDNELSKHEAVISTYDPNDLGALSSATDVFSYTDAYGEMLASPITFKLKDVLGNANESKAALMDNRHQDAKDIERDGIVIGEESSHILYGSSIGYAGIIKAIVAEVAECCNGQTTENPSSLIRFSRILLNAANRTTSGGDAFETIERYFKAPHLVFVAPDSSAPLDPIKISCKLGVFRNARGWDWGIRGRTEAMSRYLIYEAEDVDRQRPLAKIEGKCVREFGLPWPLPAFDDKRLNEDDGKSIGARGYFEVDDGGVVQISGSLLR